MTNQNNSLNIQRLDEILALSDGELFFSLLTDSFSSINPDVESFLKSKAIQSTKLRTSVTYLISKDISDKEIDLVGYFTLATKILRIPKNGLSKSEQKILSLYSHYIQGLIGGKTVFLECENKAKLIEFYESHKFKLLDIPSHLSKNNKELLQMYRIL